MVILQYHWRSCTSVLHWLLKLFRSDPVTVHVLAQTIFGDSVPQLCCISVKLLTKFDRRSPNQQQGLILPCASTYILFSLRAMQSIVPFVFLIEVCQLIGACSPLINGLLLTLARNHVNPKSRASCYTVVLDARCVGIPACPSEPTHRQK